MNDARSSILFALVLFLLYSVPSHAFSPAPLPKQRTASALDGSAKMILKERTAELFHIGEDGQEDLLWSGKLPNIPGKLFVASEGKFFVTVNTWGGVSDDPLIFYDSKGQVTKQYRKAETELLRLEELSKVPRVMVSIDWSAGSHLHFTANGQYFLLWFPWGRLMVFDSQTGKQVDPDSLRLAKHNQRPNCLGYGSSPVRIHRTIGSHCRRKIRRMARRKRCGANPSRPDAGSPLC